MPQSLDFFKKIGVVEPPLGVRTKLYIRAVNPVITEHFPQKCRPIVHFTRLHYFDIYAYVPIIKYIKMRRYG